MDRWRNRSNHVIVEAVQLTSSNVDDVVKWTKGKLVEERDSISNRMYDGINVLTPMGMMRLSLGMYAVKFQDQIYLSRRGQFESTYERLTPLAQAPEDPREAKKLPKYQKEPWFDAPKPGDPNYQE